MNDLEHSSDISAELKNTQETIDIMKQTYGDLAGDEILLRALYSHRNLDYESALFWLKVYERIYPKNPSQYF